ncbi:MAG: octaprenyl-diphosphate synthase [Gemmatimonadota bacterium]|nr:MAG: octaprenyl-diphosphate synthase [Gemmatimonadota bacterium]
MPDSLARAASAHRSTMTLPEVFALVNGELEQVEERLSSVERPDVPMTAEIMDHVLALRGKRVRPLLLILVSRLGKPKAEEVLWASTVIELVHTATLLHDDCLDGTEIRRGFPTVNHQWGQQAAILMGDYLFTKAFDLLCEHRLHHALHLLVHHVHRMTCGMNREYAGRYRTDAVEADCLRVIDEKTGALFVSSCEIGAVLGGLSEPHARGISAFGRDLGYAFQIIDDIFDFTGDPTEIGKPVGTDFRLGFATLPLLYSLADGDPERAKDVTECFQRGNATEEEWAMARDFVVSSGGIERAREAALNHAYAARDRLLAFNGHEGVAPLLATVEYMISRGR